MAPSPSPENGWRRSTSTLKKYQKRDRLTIAVQIIRACPDCLTHILQKTNLTGNAGCRRGTLAELVEAGLITAKEETDSGLTQRHTTTIYRATEKGLKYARLTEEALGLVGWDR